MSRLRPFVVRAAAVLAAALGLAWAVGLSSPDASAADGRNNYYRYVDRDGTIHVTNLPGRERGAWQLWKSLPGNASKGQGPQRRAGDDQPVALGAERFHRYDSIIRAAATRYQLPESLLRAVIHTESNYYPHAVSRAGAMGLMQLMPRTARTLGVREAFDPSQNIHGGARYLRLLANRYGGDMVLVLAAYNAGAGNVEKYGGVPPFEETRAYVRGVLRRFYAYERQAGSAGELRRAPARHLEP
jgi:hypothetical protein